MKIIYLSSSTIPSRTANSIHIMKMCQAFARNGHEVVLLAPDKTDDLEAGVDDVYAYYGVEECFEIIKLPWFKVKGRGFIYEYLAACKAKRLSPDLVYSRKFPGGYFAVKRGLTVILESHQPSEDAGPIVNWMFRKVARYTNLEKIVVITHALEEYYETTCPDIKGKIQVAPDGADPVPEDVQQIELPGAENALHVGYVGHLYKGRGLEVVAEIASRCPWANFHIVGGTEKDIQYWKEKVYGNPNIFFHGFLPPSKLESLRSSMDVLLAPYQYKVAVSGGSGNTVSWMSPLKIFEYMATGKPIISSDLPVLREVLEHNSSALLCPPDNVYAWEQALKLLSKNPELRINLGNTAYSRFISKYTWKARAKNILDNL